MRTVSLPLAVLLLVACSPNPRGTGERYTIVFKPIGHGAEVGGAVPESTTLVFDVPQGAVSTDTTVTITSLAEPAGGKAHALTPAFLFEPAGLVFAKPVRVSFKLNAEASMPEGASVYWSTGDSRTTFEALPSELTTGKGGEVRARVSHFSVGYAGVP